MQKILLNLALAPLAPLAVLSSPLLRGASLDDLFENLYGPTDDAVYRLSQQVLKGEHAWLESGIIGSADYETAERWENAAREAETVGA